MSAKSAKQWLTEGTWELSWIKRGITGMSVVAFAFAQIAPSWAQQSQSQPAASVDSRSTDFSRREYEECQTREEKAFREAIRSITLNALKAGTAELNYHAIVKDQWRRGNLDDIIDRRVDDAVAQVRDETAWSELLKSLAYRKQAQELAEATAERTYRSDTIKTALEELSTRVGEEIGRTIVLTTADAAQPAQRCLQAYLGPRYGSSVARAVNQDANAAFTIDPKTNQASISSGQVLLETSSGISGAILLLVRRQMTRMAQRIGQRLVGSILGRLVSVVAGGVGIVLIAKEFWELRNGVLPIIATEMKSAASKAKVREELAKSIREQITEHLDELSLRTADKIVDIWHDFRRAHAKVLQLADNNADFKNFLDTARATQLPRLDEIVALILKKEGEAAVQSRLNDGSLHQALNIMPEQGMQIARELESLKAAFAWTALAGPLLPKVLAFEIHKRAKPEAFSQATLSHILALDDRLAISRIAAVNRDARNVLLELERSKLLSLARHLNEAELNTLSHYLTGLSREASQRVLRIIAEQPTRISLLLSPRSRNAILASRDQMAAVGMMLSTPSAFDFVTTLDHVQMVLDGRVSPVLIWQKHPVFVALVGFFALVVLMMMRSLLFGRRRSRKHDKSVST